jgi:NADH-quinone oxidoreductase subunit K
MPVNYYIIFALALFCIGVVGVLTRRNAIIIFMCIELMLNAVNILMVSFSKVHSQNAVTRYEAAAGNRKEEAALRKMADTATTEVSRGTLLARADDNNAAAIGMTKQADQKKKGAASGQLFVFFIMVVAAAEVSVGLAIIVMMFRNIHSVDVNFLTRLKN